LLGDAVAPGEVRDGGRVIDIEAFNPLPPNLAYRVLVQSKDRFNNALRADKRV
jgi:hypothetical protein